MGCCITRVKNNLDDDSYDNPMKIINMRKSIRNKINNNNLNKNNNLNNNINVKKKNKNFEKYDYLNTITSNSKMLDESDWDVKTLFDNLDLNKFDKNNKSLYSNYSNLIQNDTQINININVQYSDTKFRRKKKRSRSNSKNRINNNKSILRNKNNLSPSNLNNILNNFDEIFQLENNISNFDKIKSNLIYNINNQSEDEDEDEINNNNYNNNYYNDSEINSKSKKDYFSICSHRFNNSTIIIEDNQNDSNLLTNSYSCTKINILNNSEKLDKFNFYENSTNLSIFYFEINYLIIWAKEFLKSTYPELNFILIITIDNNIQNCEKIFFNRTIDNNKYIPLLKKEDFVNSDKSYKFIKIPNNKNIHKININLYNYAKEKLFLISEDEIYFNTKIENKNKFKFYRNLNMKFKSKKMANLLFSFSYGSNYEEFGIFREDYKDELLYSNISNINLPIDNKNEITIFTQNKTFSIIDIHDIEISQDLKSGKINYEKLLEYLSISKKKYDLIEIIKQINSVIFNKDFDDNKILIYKEKLLSRLEIILLNNIEEIFDNVLFTLIFDTLKILFFKINKNNVKLNLKKFNKIKKLEEEDTISFNMNNLNKEEKINFSMSEENKNKIIIDNNENQKLILKSLKLSFQILNLHKEIHLELITSIINFINKIIEQENSISNEILHFVIENNKDLIIWEILDNFIETENIIIPITNIFSKLIKFLIKEKKNDIKISNFENYKQILIKIIFTHDCNSIIISNLIFILFHLLEILDIKLILSILNFTKLKEIFLNFSLNNFDFIHETIIQFIKGILLKKTENIILINEDFFDMITIFEYSLILIKNKITKMNIQFLNKFNHNLMTVLFTLINILNNIIQSEKEIIPKICNEKKIGDLVINVFYSIYEKNYFMNIDNLYQKVNEKMINNKNIIFRTLFHCISLIRNLNNKKNLNKISSEKMYKVIKNIEDNDCAFMPLEISKKLEKIYKMKIITRDDYKKLIINLKNFNEYYSRYKSLLPNFIRELITSIKS